MIAFDKIGITLMALGRINDALDAFQAERSLVQPIVEANSTSVSWQRNLGRAYEMIGNALSAGGKPDEAVAAYRSSITICDKIAGATAIAEARGILSTLHEKIGDLLMQQNKYADALLEYRQMFAATQTFNEDSARWHFDIHHHCF
jgi:tetratricopeptide (TPR) repeat protein